MEKFIEISRHKKPTATELCMQYLLPLLIMIAGAYVLVLFINMRLTTLVPLALVLLAVCTFLAYKLFCSFNIDVEYVLVEDEIRFTRIINKSRRREVVTADLRNTDCFARVDDSANNRSLKNGAYRRFDFTSGQGEKWFFSGLSSKKHKVTVIFEPDERMLETVRLVAHDNFKR